MELMLILADVMDQRRSHRSDSADYSANLRSAKNVKCVPQCPPLSVSTPFLWFKSSSALAVKIAKSNC